MLFRSKHKPSLLTRSLNLIWPRSGLSRSSKYLMHRVKRIRATPRVIALGFAAGAFASFTPFVGFHFVVAAVLAAVIGGNVLASALGTCVGNPLTFPFIWLSTYNVGGFLLGYDHRDELSLSMPDGTFWLLFTNPVEFWQVFWGALGPVLVPMMLGSLPLGIVCALIMYFTLYPAVEGYQKRRKQKLQRRRFGRPDMANSQ